MDSPARQPGQALRRRLQQRGTPGLPGQGVQAGLFECRRGPPCLVPHRLEVVADLRELTHRGRRSGRHVVARGAGHGPRHLLPRQQRDEQAQDHDSGTEPHHLPEQLALVTVDQRLGRPEGQVPARVPDGGNGDQGLLAVQGERTHDAATAGPDRGLQRLADHAAGEALGLLRARQHGHALIDDGADPLGRQIRCRQRLRQPAQAQRGAQRVPHRAPGVAHRHGQTHHALAAVGPGHQG
jgi:hypothetical protein